MLEKMLIVIVIILSIFILYALFSITFKKSEIPPTSTTTSIPTPPEIHSYKISLTHNGIPLEIGSTGLTYRSFDYAIHIYNESNKCGYGLKVNNTQSSNYTFDSFRIVNNKTLKIYEKQGYVFDLVASGHSRNVSGFYAILIGKDFWALDKTSNQLPNLSQNFSMTFELPMFNSSTSSHSNKISNNSLSIHTELVDDWNKQRQFSCWLIRNYTSSDNSLPDCPRDISLFYGFRECAQRYRTECNSPIKVIYSSTATRDGRNFDCSIPLNDLTSGKTYEVRIHSIEKISSDLYWGYNGGDFTGNISIT